MSTDDKKTSLLVRLFGGDRIGTLFAVTLMIVVIVVSAEFTQGNNELRKLEKIEHDVLIIDLRQMKLGFEKALTSGQELDEKFIDNSLVLAELLALQPDIAPYLGNFEQNIMQLKSDAANADLINDSLGIIEPILDLNEDVVATASAVAVELHSRTLNAMYLSFAVAVLSFVAMIYFVSAKARDRLHLEQIEKTIIKSEAASELKSRLLTMLSHEIRNPINGIIGAVIILDNENFTIVQKQFLDKIRASALSLIDFIGSAMSFASIEVDNKAFNKYVISRELEWRALLRIKPSYESKNLTYSHEKGVNVCFQGHGLAIEHSLYYVANFLSDNLKSGEVISSSDIHENFWIWKIDCNMANIMLPMKDIERIFSTSLPKTEISSNRLEIVIARILIEGMGGSIKLLLRDDLMRILIYFPIKMAATNIVKVHARLHSGRAREIYGHLVDGVEVFPTDAIDADIIYYEPSDREQEDLGSVDGLQVHLCAIGNTRLADRYDAVIGKNTNFEKLFVDEEKL